MAIRHRESSFRKRASLPDTVGSTAKEETLTRLKGV